MMKNKFLNYSIVFIILIFFVVFESVVNANKDFDIFIAASKFMFDGKTCYNVWFNSAGNGLKYFYSPLFGILIYPLTFLVCPLTAYLRCNQRWNLYHPGTTKEFLFYKQTLQNKLPKEAKVIVDNDESNCINLYYLNRKGWGYTKGKLTAKLIEERISQGATHLCTDTGLEKNDDLNCYFDSLVIDIKPIKIYTLKLPKQK
jgi:hypothetical protein